MAKKIKLLELIDQQQLQDMQQYVFEITGLPIGCLDNEGNLVSFAGSPESLCVNLIRKSPIGLEHCQEFATSLKEKMRNDIPSDTMITACHAGLLEGHIPIRIGEDLVGYLVIGQTFEKMPQKADAYRHAKELDIDPEIYWQMVQKTKVASREQVVKAAQFLHFIAREIISLVSTNLQLRNEIANRKKVEKERKKLTAAIQESEKKFHKAFNNCPIPLCITTLSDGIYVDVNQIFLRITGYTSEEVLGKSVFELNLLNDESSRNNILETLKSEGSIQNLKIEVKVKDGSIRHGSLSAIIIEINGVPHNFCLVRDITEQILVENKNKELEAQLFQSQKMEAIGTLAGGIAHEFNNILTVIFGYCEMGLYNRDAGAEHIKNYKHILQASERARKLVQHLLTFSRRTEVTLEEVSINRLLSEVFEILNRTLHKNILLSRELTPDLPPVKGNKNRLESVFINIANNARDAMPDGGTLTIKTEMLDLCDDNHLQLSPGKYVCIKFIDTGHGMNKATVKRIFDPFFTTKDVGKGTGLGLSMAYGIIKEHKGHIRCVSEEGKQTQFDIFLPALSLNNCLYSKSYNEKIYYSLNSETILLIEDEKSLRSLTRKALIQYNYNVVVAKNGEEALEIFKAHPDIDLVILDIIMPGIGGIECLKALRQISSDLKIIATSGYSGKESSQNVLKLGADQFLPKPYRFETLLYSITTLLHNKK